jgi:hypothetical protein
LIWPISFFKENVSLESMAKFWFSIWQPWSVQLENLTVDVLERAEIDMMYQSHNAITFFATI